MKGAGSPLDPFESYPFVPAALVGAILDARSEEGLALNGVDSRCGRHHTLRTRFLKGFVRGERNECWEWTKGKHCGYGLIRHRGSQVMAHRVAYFLTWGKIPKDEKVRQTCGNRACVNPEHLVCMTVGEINRLKAKDMKCPKGEAHPHCKATEDDVRSMRQAHRRGTSIRSIARDYGLHRASVWLIVTYRTWKHLRED